MGRPHVLGPRPFLFYSIARYYHIFRMCDNLQYNYDEYDYIQIQSVYFFFGFQRLLRPITSTQTCSHLSLSYANVSASRNPISAKFVFTLFIDLCFNMWSLPMRFPI